MNSNVSSSDCQYTYCALSRIHCVSACQLFDLSHSTFLWLSWISSKSTLQQFWSRGLKISDDASVNLAESSWELKNSETENPTDATRCWEILPWRVFVFGGRWSIADWKFYGGRMIINSLSKMFRWSRFSLTIERRVVPSSWRMYVTTVVSRCQVI